VVGTLGQRGTALRYSRGHNLALFVGLLVALAVSAPSAWAARTPIAPDPSGVIHACYGGRDGDELHIVEEGGPCRENGRPLSWNWRGRPGPEDESFAGLLLELSLSDDDEKEKTHEKGWLSELIDEAASEAGNVVSLLSLLALALVLALALARWLVSLPWRVPAIRRSRKFRRTGKLFGPALQIEAFEDGAMAKRVGSSFALLAQARIDGGRETGAHLYLVTGEERTGDYVAALQGTPQTQALAVTLSLLRLLWRRQRLTASGSLKPIDDRQTAAATVSLRLDAKLIDTSEFWLGEPPSPKLTPFASNRVLAVAVAGWIEHEVIDETPGPPAREVLLSRDSRSWALFRAGSELNRMSLLDEADNLYERALELDRNNIGALIDLAHLRRLDGHYKGAETLATDALKLIKDRNRALRRRDDEDPNWYRAQIVLATTYGEWERDKSARQGQPRDVHQRALNRALLAATSAMRARDRLERLVNPYKPRVRSAKRMTRVRERLARLINPDTLESAAVRGKIGVRTYYAARWRALVRRVERPPSREAARAERSPGDRRPRREWRSFRQSVVELHVLLTTTFEPGALLLVASTVAATRRLPRTQHRGTRCSPEELKDLRDKVKLEPIAEFERAAAIDYIAEIPNKSPRVLYNLCCWYSREARARKKVQRDKYSDEAFELLRQSISRTPPLERRSLLSHAELDRDLYAVRETHKADIAGLWRLVPTEEARLRGLDRFVETAVRWADPTVDRATGHAGKDGQAVPIQGLAVIGAWAHGRAGNAEDPVNVVLRTEMIGYFAASNDWLDVFDHPALLRRWQTSSLYRPRIELRSGLTIEFWIAEGNRIAADSDICALAGEGYEVLFDAVGDLEELLAALARAAQAASRSSGDKNEA
jgi:tetratricopeptide (TPR) repeat protein